MFYGEYRSNPERSAVHVWKGDASGLSWKAIWRFDGVRHIHGVYHDPFADSLWVTTGDRDSEAAFWRTDDRFTTLTKVVGGCQRFRAVQLLFTEEYVYFGSDSPVECNHIYRMKRNGEDCQRLAAVGNPVFYGCQIARCLFFSTAVEPSRVNVEPYAEIWGSADGARWRPIRRFRKDRWPMKWFQYGQVHFPAGPGDGQHLWYTPMATEHDHTVWKVPLDVLFG